MKLPKRTLMVLGVGAVASLVALTLGHTAFFEAIEGRSHDLRVRALHREVVEPEAVLILVDEHTLDVFKKEYDVRWPFRRDAYCPVIKFLKAAGATAVAFDIQFSEPEPMSDDELAACIAETGFVVLGYQCHAGVDGIAAPAGVTLTAGADRVKSAPCRPLLPVPPLRAAAKGFAAIDPTPDADGVLRRVRPLEAGAAGFHGTLGVGLWLAANPGATVSHHGDHIALGDRILPVDEDGDLLVRWRAVDRPFPRYSFATVFANGLMIEEGQEPALPLTTFAGKAVFIGTSAAATYEFRVTPAREADYGIHMHASVYQAIVTGQHAWRAPAWWDRVILLMMVFAIAACALLLPTVIRQGLYSLALYLVWLALTAWAFQHRGLWLDVVAPTVGMFLAFSGASVLNYLTEGRSKAQIRSAFQHYLAPEVIAELVADPSKLTLGGKRLPITAFFSDIAGFTTVSERLEPTELVAFLNEYLTALTDIILEEGGTIDKYEGDAIIAMFGAPLEHADHASRAVRSALRCQQRLNELRPGWRDRGLPEVRTRIGVNSGPAVVGNMGSSQRFDYTMIGDTVNLAARLEGTNKVYDTETMIGPLTAQMSADQVLMREVDAVRVKGKHEPVAVYEPLAILATATAPQRALKDGYERALLAYRAQDFDAARAALMELQTDHGADGPAQVLLTRIDAFASSPPPADWDGVYEMTTK